jgi:deazaflavin-dependent oxidoreductase (nitroreductase family)
MVAYAIIIIGARMDEATRDALEHSQLIDMTTTGGRTGLPRRIEISLHAFGGHLYVSGMPRADRKRAWIANLEHDPRLTIHLKRTAGVDVPATARVITDPTERRSILALVAKAWGRTDIEGMVAHSPLIELTVAGYPA